MTYTRSLREIPLVEEPHASVLDALLPNADESPYTGEIDFAGATEEQLRHLRMCPDCRIVLTGSDAQIVVEEPGVGQLGGPLVGGLANISTGLPAIPPGYRRTESGVYVASDGVTVYDEGGAVGAIGLTDKQVENLRIACKNEHNKLRDKWGKRPLNGSSVLHGYAQTWADYMARNFVMGHSSVSHRTKAMKAVKANAIGENVASGYDTAADVVRIGWRRSCAHFYNIINGSHQKIGTGVARRNGVTFWCVLMTGTANSCAGNDGCNGFCCKCPNTTANGCCTGWKSTDKNKP